MRMKAPLNLHHNIEKRPWSFRNRGARERSRSPPFSPTDRPLAEPPIFDYDHFIKKYRIASDARLKRLFAKNIGEGYKWRDAETELQLVFEYGEWTGDMYRGSDDAKSKEFYKGLYGELYADWRQSARSGSHEILMKVVRAGLISKLDLWEYHNLDDDGGTADLERRLAEGENVFELRFDKKWESFAHSNFHQSEALEKYEQLIPVGHFGRLVKDKGWDKVMSDRNAFEAKLGRFQGLKYRNAFEAMLDRFQEVKWVHDALVAWGTGKFPVEENLTGPSTEHLNNDPSVQAQEEPRAHPLEEQLSLARTDSKLVRKGAAKPEISDRPTKRVKSSNGPW